MIIDRKSALIFRSNVSGVAFAKKVAAYYEGKLPPNARLIYCSLHLVENPRKCPPNTIDTFWNKI